MDLGQSDYAALRRLECALGGHFTPRIASGAWFGTDPDRCLVCGETVKEKGDE